MWSWNLFLRHALEYAMMLPGAAACLLPMMDFLRMKLNKVLLLIALVCAGCICFGSALCVWLQVSTNTVLFPMLGLMLILCRLVCTLEWPKLLFAFFNATMLSAWGTLEAAYLFARAETAHTDLCFLPGTGAAALGLAAATMLLFGKILRVKMPRLFEVPALEKLWRWFFLIPLSVTLFFCWLIPYDSNNVLVGRAQAIASLTWLIMLGVVFAFYQFFWYISGKLGREEQLVQENRLLHAEEERYRQLQEHMQATARLRHDFRQHLRVLSQLAGENDLEQIKAYLAEYGGGIGEEHRTYCENPAADALAAWYQRTADGQMTALEWKLALPKILPIQDSVYCMILGNLLENALNAVQKLPENERLIRISSQMIGEQMMGLSVANRYAGKIPLDKRGFPVRKGQEGIGLMSVSSAVAQCSGTMAIDTAKGWFTVDILFHL